MISSIFPCRSKHLLTWNLLISTQIILILLDMQSKSILFHYPNWYWTTWLVVDNSIVHGYYMIVFSRTSNLPAGIWNRYFFHLATPVFSLLRSLAESKVMAASSSRMGNTIVSTRWCLPGCSKIPLLNFFITYPLLCASEYMKYQIFDLQRKVWKTQEIIVVRYMYIHVLSTITKTMLDLELQYQCNALPINWIYEASYIKTAKKWFEEMISRSLFIAHDSMQTLLANFWRLICATQ